MFTPNELSDIISFKLAVRRGEVAHNFILIIHFNHSLSIFVPKHLLSLVCTSLVTRNLQTVSCISLYSLLSKITSEYGSEWFKKNEQSLRQVERYIQYMTEYEMLRQIYDKNHYATQLPPVCIFHFLFHINLAKCFLLIKGAQMLTCKTNT